MVWIIGMWAPPNVSWLTHDRCPQVCEDPLAVYSDFVFGTEGAKPIECPSQETTEMRWGS